MTKNSPETDETLRLASRMLDGTISAADIPRLEAILRGSLEARRWYVDFVYLHATLQWRSDIVDMPIRIGDEAEPVLDAFDAKIFPAIHESKDVSTPPEEVRVTTARTPLKLPPPRVVSTRSFAIAASILIAVSLGVAVAIYSGLFGTSAPQTVATFTTTDDAAWQMGLAPRSGGTTIDGGQQLSLIGGSVEIAFNGGASVVVQAPANFSADTAGTMSLTSGKMAALVPPKARGFTVTAAGVSVKDLGTEFGLRCGPSTPTEVDVFKGTVEATAGSNHPSTTTLVAGDAATITAGALTTMAGGADARKFPRHLQEGNPPPEFSDADVANPAVPGSSQYSASDGRWTINGIGTDIWTTSDQFHLTSQRRDGNATIVCRVATATTEADGSRRDLSKCGVMFRGSLDSGSRFVYVVRTQNRGIQMIVRDDEYTDALTVGPYGTPMEAPVWIKLSRVGDEFTGSYSFDGSNWTKIGTHVTTLPKEILLGLAVSSGDDHHVGTATFTDVSITGNTQAKQ